MWIRQVLVPGITDDEKDAASEDVQELINKYNKIVDEKFKEKEQELMMI